MPATHLGCVLEVTRSTIGTRVTPNWRHRPIYKSCGSQHFSQPARYLPFPCLGLPLPSSISGQPTQPLLIALKGLYLPTWSLGLLERSSPGRPAQDSSLDEPPGLRLAWEAPFPRPPRDQRRIQRSSWEGEHIWDFFSGGGGSLGAKQKIICTPTNITEILGRIWPF